MTRTLLMALCLLTLSLRASSGEETLRVYHIGNSLTRNLPLERVQKLFESKGIRYDYGIQLGGGHRLEQHLSKRNHGNKPGEGEYNTLKPYGEYDHAFQNFKFDAVVLQPFKKSLDAEMRVTTRWPYLSCGDLQAASALIDYAQGKTKVGKGRWDFEHPNDHHACEQFYIYATWPGAASVLDREGEKTYAAYYAQPYSGGAVSCADFYSKLVEGLNAEHPDLKTPVRLIPAGEVMVVLDEKIRSGTLPGIEDFYRRNQSYFVKSRRNNKKPSPFDPNHFDPKAGILNFYADGVHLNDQPHNGDDSGTIGSYVAALTVYATLSGKSPVGMTVAPYEQFDEEADSQLIQALQQTVQTVVVGHKHTGVERVEQ